MLFNYQSVQLNFSPVVILKLYRMIILLEIENSFSKCSIITIIL